MDSFDVHDVPIFEKNNLTHIGEYPDRYIIEFHDILTDYFGYIFQESKWVKKRALAPQFRKNHRNCDDQT